MSTPLKSSFRYDDLDLHPDIAAALARAHASEFGHNAIQTQRQAHSCLRKLVLCLQELGVHQSAPLPASIISDVHEWLAKSSLKGSTAQSNQAIIITALKWCHRNIPGILNKRTSFAVPWFSRQAPAQRAELSAELPKTVLSACYEEIEETEFRLATGRRLLAGGAVGPEEHALAKTIQDLLKIGGGSLADQRLVGRSGQNLARRVSSAGGYRAIRELIYLTHEALFPFYLAVLIQSSGNPHAIRSADSDGAIEPHPLRDDLETLNWGKPRARHQQRIDFPIGKEWSAPNLVRRLLVLNEPLRKASDIVDGKKIFLSMGLRTGTPTVPSVQLLHTMLANFQKRHELPTFDFKDWRPTVAKSYHRLTGTVAAAQQRLNHRDARTTIGYVEQADLNFFSDRAIVRFQGELVRVAMKKTPSTAATISSAHERQEPADTVFGFRCKDPSGGFDRETPRGTTCMNFARC